MLSLCLLMQSSRKAERPYVLDPVTCPNQSPGINEILFPAYIPFLGPVVLAVLLSDTILA